MLAGLLDPGVGFGRRAVSARFRKAVGHRFYPSTSFRLLLRIVPGVVNRIAFTEAGKYTEENAFRVRIFGVR